MSELRDADLAAVLRAFVADSNRIIVDVEAALGAVASAAGHSDFAASEEWLAANSGVSSLALTLGAVHSLLAAEPPPAVEIDLGEVAARARDLLVPRLQDVGSRVEIEAEKDLPSAWGTDDGLTAAVMFLLLSAGERAATDPERGRLQLRVAEHPVYPGRPQIRVSERGQPLSNEVIEELLAGELVDSCSFDGGPKLHLAAHLFGRFGGQLHLVAPYDPNRASWATTEFCVDLKGRPEAERPTRRAARPPILSANDPDSFADLALAEFRQSARDALRVLIVDDDATILQVFAELLPSLGIEYEIAESAEDAIASFVPQRFNAAIVDKSLPGENGVELARNLLHKDRALEIVMMTGDVSDESLLEAFRLGFRDYVEKPFQDVRLFGARIEALARQQALRARTTRLRRRLALVEKDSTLFVNASEPKLQALAGLLQPPPLESRVPVLGREPILSALRKLWRLDVVEMDSWEALTAELRDGEADLVVIDPTTTDVTLADVDTVTRQEIAAGAWVVVTSEYAREPAVEAMHARAADYIVIGEKTDPLELSQRMGRALWRAREHRTDRRIVQLLLDTDIDTPEGD